MISVRREVVARATMTITKEFVFQTNADADRQQMQQDAQARAPRVPPGWREVEQTIELGVERSLVIDGGEEDWRLQLTATGDHIEVYQHGRASRSRIPREAYPHLLRMMTEEAL